MLPAEGEGRTKRIGRSTRELSSSVWGAHACHGIACGRAKLTKKRKLYDSRGGNRSVNTGKMGKVKGEVNGDMDRLLSGTT